MSEKCLHCHCHCAFCQEPLYIYIYKENELVWKVHFVFISYRMVSKVQTRVCNTTYVIWKSNTITIPGSPEPPLNCNSSLAKSRTLDIKCDPGFDGGLPQEFTIIIVNNNINKVIMNKTSIIPSFSIQGKMC